MNGVSTVKVLSTGTCLEVALTSIGLHAEVGDGPVGVGIEGREAATRRSP